MDIRSLPGKAVTTHTLGIVDGDLLFVANSSGNEQASLNGKKEIPPDDSGNLTGKNLERNSDWHKHDASLRRRYVSLKNLNFLESLHQGK